MARVVVMALGCAVGASGCVRTEDGTVMVARQLDVGRYWRRPPPPAHTPPVKSGAEIYPVPPTAGSVRQSRKRSTVARQQVSAKPLACRNEFREGKRVRVVCE